jgi:hypothetical protein
MNWELYYELEFLGAYDDLAMLMQIEEMVEEGRHYMGVSLRDEETKCQ